MGFQKKTAIVTGGARGIGEAIARRLAARGANIVLWDVQKEVVTATAAAIAEAHGVRAEGTTVDVTSAAAVGEATRAARAAFGAVDFLVNNAGVTRDNLLLRMKEEDWDRVLDINLKGAFLCTQAVGRLMLKARSGRIVNIASVIGLSGNAGQANYAASKAGLIGFTKSVAKEFAPRGVTVNAVAPGFIRTPMTDALSDETRTYMLERIPLAYFGEVEDVAAAAEFLLSDAARYITGHVLTVDGGMAM
ncbi:MAG: 3-oxoacyl-[acyl-carrier-protein] reductase [Planctomycetota bacterium]